MKRCPECNSTFSDAERFCEVDGAPLVTDPPDPLPVVSTGVAPTQRSNAWLLPIGVMLGILLGFLVVLVYFAMSRQRAPEDYATTGSSSSAQQQEVPRPPQRAPLETGSPSPEPSVEPSPSPSIETPSPQTNLELSNAPISTAAGGKGSDPVIIRLQSGLTIEADEAWQTGEGIWYRKNGVVSLLDPRNVKTIEKVSPAAPQSSAPSSSPSP